MKQMPSRSSVDLVTKRAEVLFYRQLRRENSRDAFLFKGRERNEERERKTNEDELNETSLEPDKGNLDQ